MIQRRWENGVKVAAITEAGWEKHYDFEERHSSVNTS